jgi:hypothetical protein
MIGEFLFKIQKLEMGIAAHLDTSLSTETARSDLSPDLCVHHLAAGDRSLRGSGLHDSAFSKSIESTHISVETLHFREIGFGNADQFMVMRSASRTRSLFRPQRQPRYLATSFCSEVFSLRLDQIPS